MPTLTADEVRKIFNYDPITGHLTWKNRPNQSKQWNARYSGKRAGSIASNRKRNPENNRKNTKIFYRIVSINGKTYRENRIIYLLMMGHFPFQILDHKNQNSLDNRWSNLRPASHAQNAANRRLHKNNKSGYKGVSQRPNGRFQAQIMVHSKLIYLGIFDTPQLAHAAYNEAAKKHFKEFANNGQLSP